MIIDWGVAHGTSPGLQVWQIAGLNIINFGPVVPIAPLDPHVEIGIKESGLTLSGVSASGMTLTGTKSGTMTRSGVKESGI